MEALAPETRGSDCCMDKGSPDPSCSVNGPGSLPARLLKLRDRVRSERTYPLRRPGYARVLQRTHVKLKQVGLVHHCNGSVEM